MLELLAELMAEVPVSRRVDVEGWPKPVWIWKLETPVLIRLARTPHKTEEEIAEYSLALCRAGVGDETGPGLFESKTGATWLKRQGNTLLELAKAVQDFNELTGPSGDREKKFDSPVDSVVCSPSAEPGVSDTQDDCL